MIALRTATVWNRVLTPVLAIAFGACGRGSGYGPGHAKVTLLAEKKSFVPGTEALLAVRFDIEPEWHLYWKGQNDTGFPPRLALDLPKGFVAGDLLWPVPKRHVSPGGILDHIYEGRTTLLLPLVVPKDAVPGRAYEIRGEASWLACREACVPGKSAFALTMKVQDSPVSDADPITARLIAAAKASLPRPEEDARARVARSWENGSLVLRSTGASRLTFFPDTASVVVTDLLHAGEAEGDALRLSPQKSDPSGQISGILGIETPADTLYFLVREPLPQP
jgi:DsbC/DsbD-like thiol-disulfide interchange protein